MNGRNIDFNRFFLKLNEDNKRLTEFAKKNGINEYLNSISKYEKIAVSKFFNNIRKKEFVIETKVAKKNNGIYFVLVLVEHKETGEQRTIECGEYPCEEICLKLQESIVLVVSKMQ